MKHDEQRSLQHLLRRSQRLAQLLDNAYTIPGTSWRIGWDAILGLLPGAGDLITTFASLWILYDARRLGIPRRLQAQMFSNLFVDTLVGSIPLLGDLFDARFKANIRNVRILERYLRNQQL